MRRRIHEDTRHMRRRIHVVIANACIDLYKVRRAPCRRAGTLFNQTLFVLFVDEHVPYLIKYYLYYLLAMQLRIHVL